MMIGFLRGELTYFSLNCCTMYFTMLMPTLPMDGDEMYTPKMLSLSFTCLWNFNIFLR